MLSALLALGILTAALIVYQSSDDSGKGGGRREPALVRVRVNYTGIQRRRSR